MVILQIICCVCSDLSDKNPESNKKTLTVYKWIIPIISIVMYSITVMYALGNMIDIRVIVMMILGILFIVMGNYVPKVSGNSYMKYPKMFNEIVNKKISRIYGYLLIANGVLFLISILFNSIVSAVLVILMIIETIALYIYGAVKSKSMEKEE